MFAIITIIESILIVSQLWERCGSGGAKWCGVGGGKGDACRSLSLSVSMDVTSPKQ